MYVKLLLFFPHQLRTVIMTVSMLLIFVFLCVSVRMFNSDKGACLVKVTVAKR